HDTDESLDDFDAAGLGLLTSDQALPFHRSVNVTVFPALFACSPTAMQSVAFAHDTPLSWLEVAVAASTDPPGAIAVAASVSNTVVIAARERRIAPLRADPCPSIKTPPGSSQRLCPNRTKPPAPFLASSLFLDMMVFHASRDRGRADSYLGHRREQRGG